MMRSTITPILITDMATAPQNNLSVVGVKYAREANASAPVAIIKAPPAHITITRDR